jgi:predicted phage tail protein
MTQIISGAGGGCFRKGTLVQQENGITIPIEQITVGDKVLAFDDLGNIFNATVVKTHYHETPQPILHVKFWRGELFATPNHWVLNQFNSFVELGTLTEDDALQDGMGHLRPILSSEVIAHEPVYNLTVEPYHTFIANEICVHNGGHRETYPVIRGAGGGGKGGGGGRPAKEAPNTLRSVQYAEVIDVVSEGEILGFGDPQKSAGNIITNSAEYGRAVYFDGVPLLSSDNTENYTNVKIDFRTGTQNQAPVPSALNGVSTTKRPGFASSEIKYGDIYAKLVTITDTEVKKVDVTISVPSLTHQDNTTGDLNGSSVSFTIKYQVNGSAFWYTAHDTSIAGKCTSLYEQSYSLDFSNLLNSQYPVQIKVTRTKADATSVAVQDKMYWQSYTEHIPTRLSYPNTALVNIKIDAEQFSQIPTRGFLLDGIKVLVPSNYNPLTREYANNGIWDGNFKLEWTNNPAWVYYDLVTNERYGLGGYMTQDNVDKWSLYTIAKYCDELVPTGFKKDGISTYEPRFTCNAFIYSQEDAYSLLTSIASVFRAIQYWALGQFSLSIDKPKDAMMQFTPANVIDGQFSYSGTSLKTRHTVAAITWNDPADMYTQKIEYVEDIDAISKWGIIQTDVIAFGCTSQGQAHRLGKWVLYSEQMETETVSFKTGIENCILLPGDIIQTSDPFRSGNRYGGRIVSHQPTSFITLDSEVPTGNYSLSIYTPEKDTQGNLRGKLTTISGSITNNLFTSNSPITATITPESVWVAVITGTIEPEYWRVVGIKEEEDHVSATITALEYRLDKFAAVEQDLVLQERPTSLINYDKPATPYIDQTTIFEGPIVLNGIEYATYTNAQSWCQEYLYYAGPSTLSNAVTLSWTGTTSKYKVKWRQTGTLAWTEQQVDYPFIDIRPIQTGSYDVEIYAINTLNRLSDALAINMTILGKAALPNDIAGLSVSKQEGSISISWFGPDNAIYSKPDLDLAGYEIRELYSVGTLDPYTKLVNNQIVWKNKTELGNYFNTVFTDAQYYQKLNDKWDALSNAKAEDGLITNTSYVDLSAVAGYNCFLVKAVDTSGNYSKVPSLIGIPINGPGQVTTGGIQSRIDGEDLVISWPRPDADVRIDHYLVTIDNQNYTVYTEEFRRKAWFIGTRVFEVTPFDRSGNSNTKVSINITIQDNLAPQSLTYSLVDDIATIQVTKDSFKLTWDELKPAGLSLSISEYEIRTDANFGQLVGLIAKTASKQYVSKVTWGGSKTIYVGAKNSAGFYTAYSQISISIVSPSVPSTLTNKVIDNNVLLYWSAPSAGGSLPIDEYVIKKGTTIDTAIDIGTKAGNFTTVFETVGGDYVYWVAAKDTAGNIGTYKSTAATVNQPPDYVLQFDYTTDFTLGTKTNAAINSLGYLTLPVYGTETFTGHFTALRVTSATIVSGGTGYAVGDIIELSTGTATYKARVKVLTVSAGVITSITIVNPGVYSVAPSAAGATLKVTGSGSGLTLTAATAVWSTAQNQVDAGYPIYIQPEVPTGSYQETKDYGTTLTGNTVTITTDIEEVVLGAQVTYKIESSLDNSTWVSVADAKQGYATNFRYIRLTVTVAGGLINLKLLNTKIDSKLKTQAGVAYANSGDMNGTTVYLTNNYLSTGAKIFKDVQAITVTPAYIAGQQPVAVYDFTDSADPLSFSIYLYDSLTGLRVSGNCSYTIRGV